MTTGVGSPKDKATLSQSLKQINGEIARGEYSGDSSAPIAGIDGCSLKETHSQDLKIQATGLVNNSCSKSINNNNPATSTNRKSNVQPERHENAGDSSNDVRGEERDISAIVPQVIKPKTMSKENSNHQGEDSNKLQGNYKENMATHSATSSSGTSNFSFAKTGTSSHLTPNLNEGNTQERHRQQDNGGIEGKANGQSHEQVKENYNQSGSYEQHAVKEKKNFERAKLDQGQRNSGKQNDQTKHSYKQGEGNFDNQLNRAREEYHSNFPRISNNFERYDPKLQTNCIHKQASQAYQSTTRDTNNHQQGQQSSKNNKNEQSDEPAPYTMIQSFAARLRYNQAQNESPITLNEPIHTTRQGFLVVLIDENDNYVKLAEICKYTLVGKFTNTMPRMEQVRNSFVLQTQLMGGVKITHYNSRHVYIDLDNEIDYQTV